MFQYKNSIYLSAQVVPDVPLTIKLEKTEYVKQNSLRFSFQILLSVFLHLKSVTRQQHRGGKCQSYLVNTHLSKSFRITSTEERTRVAKIGKCRRQILHKAIDHNPSHICWKMYKLYPQKKLSNHTAEILLCLH